MAPKTFPFEPPRPQKAGGPFDKGLVRSLAELGALGFILVASTFAFMGLGWLCDHYLGTSPFGVIGGILIGAAMGLYNLIRTATRFKSDETPK